MLLARKAIIAVTLCVAAGVTSAAGAQDLSLGDDGVRSIEVNYSDINIANADGQRRMSDRIRSAAKRVCGYNTHRLSIRDTIDLRTCVNAASENAMTLLAANTTGKIVVAVRVEEDTRRY